MRQTIQCVPCAEPPFLKKEFNQSGSFEQARTEHGVTEHTSFDLGFPLHSDFRCDDCGVPLPENQLVVALGTWSEDRGISNIEGWFKHFIREATRAEIAIYFEAEKSAQEMRRDNG